MRALGDVDIATRFDEWLSSNPSPVELPVSAIDELRSAHADDHM